MEAAFARRGLAGAPGRAEVKNLMNGKRTASLAGSSRISVAVVALTALIGVAHALTFDEVLAPLRRVTDKCQPIEGVHAWSSQARSLYEKEGLAKTLNLESVAKASESFQCGRSKATVYLYSYATPLEAQKALPGVKTYIWGDTHRTIHHPEFIFAVDNVVVVVSGYKPKAVAEVLMPSQRDAGNGR